MTVVRWYAGVFLVLGAIFALAFVADASSATYSTACPSAPGAPDPGTITDDAIETRNQRIEDVARCVAETERLELLVTSIEAVEARLAALDDSAPGTTAQRVALAPADRERLDLAWWGMWALVGLTLVLLFSSKWHSAWRFLRE